MDSNDFNAAFDIFPWMNAFECMRAFVYWNFFKEKSKNYEKSIEQNERIDFVHSFKFESEMGNYFIVL